jgi:CRP/FNR family cyclic AMP-dependent transcriptional regulator
MMHLAPTLPGPSAACAAFSGDDWDFMTEHATPRSFAKGSIIISEGDEALALYVVVTGELKVYTTTQGGKEIILRVLGPGDYFGELTLFDDAPRSASVKASAACQLLVLSKGRLADCLARRPQLYSKLLRDVSVMVRRTTDELRRVASMDVYQRIAKLLLELATRQGDDLVVAQRLTQQELANRVCASREMVSRVLQGLVAGGYITIERRQITIRRRFPEKW